MLIFDFSLFLYMAVKLMFAGKLPYINTGNCSYADNVELQFVCNGKLSETIHKRWGDRRTDASTEYAVWQSSDEKDAIVLVSFVESKLQDYKTIKVESQHYKLFGIENGKSVEVELKDGDLNCFPYGSRYVSDLKNHCLDLDYNANDIVAMPIIHYAKPILYAPDV